ncbi:hypothetical protein BGW39_004408 [Mortierella sp. 14UC]|nr:hypothetical protein BGW39_004408 [Mortierella sp. 14UC]
MVKLLECYFPRLRHLHLDGIPVSLSIEITTGPPEPTNQRQHQQPRSKKDHQTIFAFDSAISEEILEDATTTDAAMRAAELSCLERVLTRENESAQQVLEYRLVPLLNEKSQMESMVEQLGMTAHSVLYTIGRKNWLRIAS